MKNFDSQKALCSVHGLGHRIYCEECQEKSKYMMDFVKAEQEQNAIEQKKYDSAN